MSARRLAPIVPLVALFAGFGLAGGRCARANALELKPAWKKGDTARYEMVRTRVRQSDGQEIRKVTARTAVEVEVLAADAGGSVLRWTQGSTVFDEPKLDDPSARAFNAILKNTDIDLQLDASGTFTGVRNWKEIRATGPTVRDAVLAQMARGGAAKATIDLLRKETDKFFATRESIEAAFTPHPVLLVLPFGRAYEVGNAVAYETELPNVLGGDDPFPAKGEYALQALDRHTNTATLVFKQVPDEKEMNRVLRKWLEELAKKTGKPAPTELPELALADAIEYQFDLTAGWVKSVTHTRTARQPALTQTETIVLTRKTK